MRNLFEVHGGVAVIFLQRKDGQVLQTVIDASDLARAREFPNTWYASWNPPTQSFYVYGKLTGESGKRVTLQLHRWLTDVPGWLQVDHINHDTLDNQRHNLRIANRSENGQNKGDVRRNNRSGFRGVSWCNRSRKWLAQLMIDGKTHHVGYFSNKEVAAHAVQRARAEMMPFSKEAMQI